MRKTITLNTFRRVASAEEAMMRTLMPRASAASPEPLATYGWEPNTKRTNRTLTMKAAFSVGDVASWR